MSFRKRNKPHRKLKTPTNNDCSSQIDLPHFGFDTSQTNSIGRKTMTILIDTYSRRIVGFTFDDTSRTEKK